MSTLAAILGDLVKNQQPNGRRRPAWRLGVEVFTHNHPDMPYWYIVTPRSSSGFRIRSADKHDYDLGWGMDLLHMNSRRLIRKSIKTPQAVANALTDYGKSSIGQVKVGLGSKSDTYWWVVRTARPQNMLPASATRIQAAWRGLQGRRQAARNHVHRELALVPPMHGFPGGAEYLAASKRYAASVNAK